MTRRTLSTRSSAIRLTPGSAVKARTARIWFPSLANTADFRLNVKRYVYVGVCHTVGLTKPGAILAQVELIGRSTRVAHLGYSRRLAPNETSQGDFAGSAF